MKRPTKKLVTLTIVPLERLASASGGNTWITVLKEVATSKAETQEELARFR